MIGFKEWALVCRALEDGTTSLIVRKGGIAEGRDGFRFKFESFLLFPTLFHEQLAKTRLPADTELPVFQSGQIEITARATVEWTQLITDRAVLKRLEPHHILQPSVVEERFLYDETIGVNVAFLRVEKASRPFIFPDGPKYGGCRSWVELPEVPEDIIWTPVLSNSAHKKKRAELQSILSGS